MCTMTSIVKKVLKAGCGKPVGSSNSLKPPRLPVCPPSPDLSGLTPEEVHILNEVFRRQEVFEEEEKSRTRRLQRHIQSYEEQIKQHASSRNKRSYTDLRICRLCYKNKFADGIGRVCVDCRRRVCNKCGCFARPKWDPKKNKSVRGKWQCTMCHMKRELLCQTGIWFHGTGSKPTFNRKSFKAKVEASGLLETESDWGVLADRTGTTIPGHRTDSELLIKARNTNCEKSHCHKFHRRRSQLSMNDSLHDKDDEDTYIDDAQFQRERQQDRKHRFQKKCRRRLPKVHTNHSLDNDHHCVSVDQDSICFSELSLSGESASDGHVESKLEVSKSKSPTKSRSREISVTKRIRGPRRRRKSSYSDASLETVENSKETTEMSKRHPLKSKNSKNDSYQSHCKIVRQAAVSRSSSSTSIISDAKSSDIHSSAASPIFQRHDTLQFRESPKISIRTSSIAAVSAGSLDLVLPSDCTPQLLAPPTPTTHRRVTLSECENITINTTGEQGRYHPSSPHAVIIHRDKQDASYRTGGLGMRIVGGKSMPDGSVGAYVTHVIKGGPADAQAGIRVGDIIQEWNGRSLRNATFEEAREIMDKCKDIVQLVVLHMPPGQSEDQESTVNKTRMPKSDSVDGQLVHKTFITPTLETPKDSCLINRPKRRMLPKTPIEIKKETKQISGRLLVKLSYSPATSRLTVATIRAEGLKPRSGSTKTLPRPLLLLYLLPGRNDTGHYETQPGYETTNPEWNKTFIFAEITGNSIQEKALEITVWDKNYSGDDEFLGEVLLDLKDASLDNETVWFNLEDHDDNSSPLPIRKKSFSDISPLSSSSSIDLMGQRSQGVRTPSPNFSGRRSTDSQRCLPLTPAHDKAKQLLNRGKTSPCRECRSDKDVPTSRNSSPLPSPGSMTDPDNRGSLLLTHRDSFTKKVKRKMSSAVTKMMGERKESDDDKESCSSHGWLGRSRSIGDMQENSPNHGRSPRSHRRSTIHMDLLAPPRPLSRTPSETSFDDDEPDGYSFNSRTPDRPAIEGDDITSLLGPGQAPPKPAMEKVILGDLKLGFMVTKGQLEVDVICAKGLTRGPAAFPPDTYVKTYLMEGNKKIQKKKTKLIKGSYEPIYRQKLKYSACNVYGRSMRVNIWERQKTFDKKVSLGEVVVRLDNLDLSQHITGWYKLFQISAADIGSTDSLVNW